MGLTDETFFRLFRSASLSIFTRFFVITFSCVFGHQSVIVSFVVSAFSVFWGHGPSELDIARSCHVGLIFKPFHRVRLIKYVVVYLLEHVICVAWIF